MPRVRFIKRFDWNVPGTNRRQSVAYLPGMRELVTSACAEEAVEAGAAEYVEKFNKGEPAIDKPPDDGGENQASMAAAPRVAASSARSTGKGK